MARCVDVNFDSDELLWRRFEVRALTSNGVLRASSLRLQISVIRGAYARRDDVPHGKWNGIAETTAGEASSLSHGALEIVCVDDPHQDNEGHALLAIVAKPGSHISGDDVDHLRRKLALSMRVVALPS